ncbi:MAG: dihydrodipicolinate synthase family protein, partial [Acidobacteriota bacterium]
MKEIKGIITPLVTPFSGGALDRDALSSLMEYQKKIGVSAVFPAGSTGLFALLSVEGQKKVIGEAIDAAKGLPVVAGASRNDLEETASVAKYAEDAGADALAILPPYYFRVDQRSIYDYYAQIAGKVDTPVLIYNNPGLAGNSVEPRTASLLMQEYSGIVGVKDSSGNLRVTQAYLSELPRNALVYQGSDDLLLPSMALGISGGVCGTANFSPLAERLWEAGIGHAAEGREISA